MKDKRIPPGPTEEFRGTEDLLGWLGNQFQKFGHTYKAFAFGTNVYVTRDPDLAYHVLVENWQNYVKGQFIKRVAILLGNGLMVSEGALWKRQRRMIQPSFQPQSIPSLIKLIASVNSALLKKWQAAAKEQISINVTKDVSTMALEVVLRSILGNDYQEFGLSFNLVTGESARDLAFAQSFRALGKIVLQIVARRRTYRTRHTDLLSGLMEARDVKTGQPMDDRQLINEVLTLIVAGHETTASTLNWTWYLISQHPEIEQKLAHELAGTEPSSFEDPGKFRYTRQVIEEAMRLYPAGWLMTRKALRDDWLGDYFVPAATEIYIPSYFIQRHPDLWVEPDRFNPDRYSADHLNQRQRLASIPFSSGPRNCIGSHFARAEMLIHLVVIAKHLRLRYFHKGLIELDPGVNLRSKEDFIMYPEARTPTR